MPPSAETARPPLPAEWVHRTPERAWYGPLEPGAGVPPGGLTRDQRRRALEVLRVLTRYDFRARYRAQALGALWSFANPLVMMAIIALVFSRVFRTTTPHFPIFLLIGLVFWQWITSSLSAATLAFVSNAELVKRTVFWREALPISSVLSYAINFGIESLVVVGFVPIFPHAFRLSPALLLVPVLVASAALLLSGVALATSVLNVIYRDVAYIVNTGLTLLYWLTPVMYPVEVIPRPWRSLLEWNPAAAILEGLRGAIMLGRVPGALDWARILLPTILIFALGWRIFRRHERLALDYV